MKNNDSKTNKKSFIMSRDTLVQKIFQVRCTGWRKICNIYIFKEYLPNLYFDLH